MIGCYVVATLAALALTGRHWRPLELYAELSAQIATAGVVAAPVAFLFRVRHAVVVASIGAAALSVVVVPAFLPPSVSPPAAVPKLRIVWANLQNWTTGAPALARLLDEERPDIAVLTELSAHHERAAADRRAAYPFQSAFPQRSAFDLLLISRRAPTTFQMDRRHGAEFPVMEARFCGETAGAPCLAIISLHAPRPELPGGFLGLPPDRRDASLALAAELARARVAAGDRVMLLGDLNTTPFSIAFRRTLEAGNLADTASAPAESPRRPLPTWFSTLPAAGLAIDHALIGPGISVVERRLGPDIGSDHRPLVIDIRLPGGR